MTETQAYPRHCAIQPTTHADFQNDRISRISENSRKPAAVRISKTEIGFTGIGISNATQCIRQSGIVDQLTWAVTLSNPIAFMPVHQMRRCMNMDGEARGLQQSTAEGADRSLAVRAGNVNDGRQNRCCGFPEHRANAASGQGSCHNPLGCSFISSLMTCSASLRAMSFHSDPRGSYCCRASASRR